MKKSIFLFVIVTAATLTAFISPAPVLPVKFVTLEVVELTSSAATPNADSTLWTFQFQYWYGVKDNPYTKKVGGDWRWGEWTTGKIVVPNTSIKRKYRIAMDSANAYRQRAFPDTQ